MFLFFCCLKFNVLTLANIGADLVQVWSRFAGMVSKSAQTAPNKKKALTFILKLVFGLAQIWRKFGAIGAGVSGVTPFSFFMKRVSRVFTASMATDKTS